MSRHWTQQVNGVSRDLVLSCKTPGKCNASQLKEFEATVRSEGEVDERQLPAGVKRAHTLFLLYDDNVIAAVGGLKRPRQSYRKSVFEKAAATAIPSLFSLEFGWVAVTEGFKGNRLSSRLAEVAVEVGGTPMFATSEVNNERMHSALRRAGFESHGKPYHSDRGPYDLVLFLYTPTSSY